MQNLISMHVHIEPWLIGPGNSMDEMPLRFPSFRLLEGPHMIYTVCITLSG